MKHGGFQVILMRQFLSDTSLPLAGVPKKVHKSVHVLFNF